MSFSPRLGGDVVLSQLQEVPIQDQTFFDRKGAELCYCVEAGSENSQLTLCDQITVSTSF